MESDSMHRNARTWKFYLLMIAVALSLIASGIAYYKLSIFVTLFVTVTGTLIVSLLYREAQFNASVAIWSTVLAIFWVISSYSGGLVVIQLASLPAALVTLFVSGMFIYGFVIQMIGINWQRKQGKPSSVKFILISMSIISLVWLLVLLAVWPGILTPDSFKQWGQVSGYMTISEWHPILHTLFIKLASFLYYSPASFLLIQILFGAWTISWIINKLLKRGMPIWLGCVLTFGYAVYPMGAVQMSTLWKDVTYSIVLLLLFYYTAVLVEGNGAALKSWQFIIGYTVLLFFSAQLRHNGLYVVIAALIFLGVYLHSKQIAIVILATFSLNFGFNYISSNVFHAAKNPTYQAFAVPMQQVGAVYKQNGTFTKETREYFDKVLPAREWKRLYNPYSVDPLKHSQKFDGDLVNQNPKLFLLNWGKLLMHNKSAFIVAFLNQSAFIWKMNLSKDETVQMIGSAIQFKQVALVDQYRRDPKKTELTLRKSYSDFIKQNINAGQPVIGFNTYKKRVIQGSYAVKYNSKLPRVRAAISQMVLTIESKEQTIWANGAFAFFVLLIAILIAAYKTRFLKCFGFFLVPVLNWLSLAAASPAPDFRYIYSLCFSVVPILLFIVSMKSDHHVTDADV